ncbi:MAG: hypothetical protein FWD11_11545, partial [Micrococcales bacterium]|nr:hypothetical protein [Micrococcales bacterium]
MKNRLAGLDEVDWGSLDHAYGKATDTPKLIKRLYKPKKHEYAVDAMWNSILYQGTIYPATIEAVPFLAEVAADPTAPGRRGAFELLTGYAESVRAEWTRQKAYLSKKTNMVQLDRRVREVLAASVSVLLPCLADDDPQVRRSVARFCHQIEDLPAEAIVALRECMVREVAPQAAQDPTVLSTLVVALSSHDALTGQDTSRLHGTGDLVQFAAAWSAVAADRYDRVDLETLAELWNTCAHDFGQLDLTDGVLVPTRPGAVAWLADLASRGGVATSCALDSLDRLLRRRDLFPAALDAVLHFARRPPEGFDRHGDLVTVLSTAASVPGNRRTELLETLSGVVRSALVGRGAVPHWRVTTYPMASGSAIVISQHKDDIRADALPALVGCPGSMELLREVLDDASGAEVRSSLDSETGLFLELTRRLAQLTPDQTADLAAIIMEQLRTARGIQAGWRLTDLVALPDTVTRPWWDEVVGFAHAAARASTADVVPWWPSADPPSPGDLRSILGRALVPTLTRWGTPAVVELLEEWAVEPGELSRWAMLGLGRLRGDADLVDAAFVDGLPAARQVDFLDLANGFTTPRMSAVCEAELTGEAAGYHPERHTQLACARAVAGTSGLATVWPTVLAV